MFKLIDYVPRSLSRFISDKRGQVAMIFGLSLIPVTGGVGAAIDYSTISHVKAQLQASLDSAVLAGALDQTSNQNTTATNVFATNFQPNYSGVTYSNLVFSVRGDGAFTGSVKATVPTTFMNVLGVPTVLVATTSAAGPSAVAANGNALCLLALNATAQSAIDDSGGTSVSAPNCIVQVNSSNSKAVTLSGSAAISSAENCFVGKVSTSGSASVKPGPDAVCNSKSDPFKNRSVPSVSSCDHTNFKTSTPITLQPGVYCGGISISSTTVTFAPGLYIIKGGLLTSSGGSKITGNGVSFYLTGSDTGVSTSGGDVVGNVGGLRILPRPLRFGLAEKRTLGLFGTLF
jgi:Flp pilus assembly protein TadG